MATPAQIIAAVAPIVGRAGAAGVAGNTMQESSDRSNAPGGGLAQWQGPRAAAEAGYARAHGLAPGSDAAALGYLRQDLQTNYAGLASQLRRTKDPGQAAVLFEQQYERAGIPMNQNRINYARQAARLAPGAVLVPGMAPAKGQRGTVASIPGQPNTIGGGVNTEALAEAVLAKEASKPIITASGHGASQGNPFGDYLSAEATGKFNVPTSKATTPSSVSASGGTAAMSPSDGSLRKGSLGHLTGKAGNVNPLGTGWTLERTDMGVDARANPGQPVRAINDSRVVAIQPNWYSGQPLIMLQLTAGPDKGKYWYVAEQITPGVHVGQQVAAGDPVARFASHGTGIEIGWGSPSGQTLAQATGHDNANEDDHANTPAGLDFKRRILGG